MVMTSSYLYISMVSMVLDMTSYLYIFMVSGVTQELIDETRLSSEHKMLADMISVAQKGGDLEVQGRSGETPVSMWELCF